MKRAYTIERNELICDLYRKGKTINEISDSMKLGKGYIRKILVEGDLAPEFKCKRIPEETRAKIIDMLKAGIPQREICAELGVTSSVVGYYAYAYNLSLKPRVTKDQIELMLQLRNEGYNNTGIAERMGISLSTVDKHIGNQPKEISRIYVDAGVRISKIRREARLLARCAMKNLEANREAERIEALRTAKQAEIRELLSSLGIPSENFTIDSAESGDAFLNNLITRATEKLSVGA